MRNATEVSLDFTLFRNNRRKGGTNTRLNKEAVDHIVAVLLPYYKELRLMKSGERADFIIFLFEKALKEKMPDYIFSWSEENTHKKDMFNAPFE